MFVYLNVWPKTTLLPVWPGDTKSWTSLAGLPSSGITLMGGCSEHRFLLQFRERGTASEQHLGLWLHLPFGCEGPQAAQQV